ncbi:MAG: orotidine-5'-phosphate decarboxylase [Thermomicrobiales bacterium]|nr:orotidine-5'-phosphate decarboxylase [Thermomicrobiales bacterium]
MVESFADQVRSAADRANSLVCVGLDPDLSKFPDSLSHLPPGERIAAFNKSIIEATADLVCCYKPNLAFYAAHGIAGLEALLATRDAVPAGVPVLLDCKVGDIGSTAAAYARAFFDEWDFDGITVNPYLGEDSLAPFLGYEGKGVIIVCKTSNPGGGDFQDLTVGDATLFETVAGRAVEWSAKYPASIGLVVGATWPEQLARVRAIAPDLPILLPGVGAQSGDVAAALRAGLDVRGGGLLVSSSRGIIYASNGPDFAEAARTAAITLRDSINEYRPIL